MGCSKSFENWNGGFYAPSGAAGAGAFQLPDSGSLPDQRAAVLAAPAGSYGDVFNGEPSESTFICRVQHMNDGINTYAKVISPFYLSRLDGYDSEVVDLTDPAEMNVYAGSLDAWNGGIATTGDAELELLFMGLHYRERAEDCFAQALLWDPGPVTLPDLSFIGIGLGVSGVARYLLGGIGYYQPSNFWSSGTQYGNTTTRIPNFSYLPFAGQSMPTTPERCWLEARIMKTQNLGYGQILAIGYSIENSIDRQEPARQQDKIVISPARMIYRLQTGGSTTQKSILEAVSYVPSSTPFPGY